MSHWKLDFLSNVEEKNQMTNSTTQKQ